MLTYFVYKCIIYDILIESYLFNGDCLEQAFSLFAIITYGILGLFCVVADILMIPLYLLIGILALIFNLIRR